MDTEAEEIAKHQELMRERALLVTHMISKLMIDFLSNNIVGYKHIVVVCLLIT